MCNYHLQLEGGSGQIGFLVTLWNNYDNFCLFLAEVQHVTVKEISDMKRPGNTSDLRHRPSLWLPAQLTSGGFLQMSQSNSSFVVILCMLQC